MLDGDLYIVDDEIAALHLRAVTLTEAFDATPGADPAGRRRILEELVGQIGVGTEVRTPFRCDYGTNIRFGARVFVNFGLVVLDVATITIGDDAQIGPNVQLLTADPPPRRGPPAGQVGVGPADRHRRQRLARRWCDRAPRGLVGRDAVVGAGAVVTRDVPDGAVVAAAPPAPSTG